MGSNFHTPWVDGSTAFSAASMNPALAALDKAITYIKNVMIYSDNGKITYVASTGVLTWSGTLKIVFIREDGLATVNTVTAGNITLSENEFCYVTLSETNNAAVTMSKASIPSGGSASPVKGYNILVIGFRNAATVDADADFYPCVPIPQFLEDLTVLVPKSGATMTGALIADDNTNYDTAQMRNVIISTSDPSGGQAGDIWIKYTA